MRPPPLHHDLLSAGREGSNHICEQRRPRDSKQRRAGGRQPRGPVQGARTDPAKLRPSTGTAHALGGWPVARKGNSSRQPFPASTTARRMSRGRTVWISSGPCRSACRSTQTSAPRRRRRRGSQQIPYRKQLPPGPVQPKRRRRRANDGRGTGLQPPSEPRQTSPRKCLFPLFCAL